MPRNESKTLNAQRILQQLSLRRAIAISFVLMAVYAALVLNWQYGSLRFAIPLLNCLTLAIALLLPSVCIYFFLKPAPRRKAQVWAAIGLAPVAICSLLPFLGTLFVGSAELLYDQDYGLTSLASVQMPNSILHAYRDEEAGAMVSPYIIIQQERQILPGIIQVKCLYTESPAWDVAAQRIDITRARFTFPPYDDGTECSPTPCDDGEHHKNEQIVLNVH